MATRQVEVFGGNNSFKRQDIVGEIYERTTLCSTSEAKDKQLHRQTSTHTHVHKSGSMKR